MRVTKKEPDHIHRADDGRGKRQVYLDGRQIFEVFFADTRRGIVDCYMLPFRADKYRKRVLSKRMRGTVTVVFDSQ